ncbi:toll/interleukin-1 receptor domain-containing protein [Anaeromicropila populeti]|uniref:TIR domain-containing protein n=1 Tax=Anaeromicropila populeti TaxID=37658 RepID=A0A1I6LRQ8_9FIRM|nr:toll/interleukin-1 receptor domain-containing protein [Anaeromicropila populeti]SFS06187.1 TIR domain-containing protein [Anaeromicropila populeti]
MRVFLSHSSKDKEFYVSKVAKRIGRDRVVYDELTFEEGLKSIDEINRTLKASDLFVVFLSLNSIESDWVKYELFKAHDLLDEGGKIQQIYPIIIDNKLKYNDPKIPDWLRDNNLQLVVSSNKASDLILQRLRELSYKQHPRLEEKNKIFVGRNDIINMFEMRINDFEKVVPFSIFASGIQNIGRKKVMYYSFLKVNLIRSSYRMPIVELNSHESIEDFILKIDDLGLTQSIKRTGLLNLTLEEKIALLKNILEQIKEERQRIFIEDNGCIITHDRELVGWFKELYKSIRDFDYIVMGVSSIYRIYESYTFELENIFFAHVPELNKEERAALFYKYLQFENIKLSTEDIRHFVDLLSGFPEQAYYAVRLINEMGLPRALLNSKLIIDYNSDRVIYLINELEKDKNAMNILALLSEYSAIGYNTFFNIVGYTDENNDILEKLFSKGICETFGRNKEYIRLNDIVHDYLIRMGLKIPENYKKIILNSLNNFIEKQVDGEYITDISEYQYLIKKAIIENRIDEVTELLVPSHYLQSMKELYDVRKNYDDVISLAYRVLENDKFMDEHISNEIRYYLCMSLARMKDQRFKAEVMKIKGAEHDFLYGFYYRQTGNTKKAIEKYEIALRKRKRFARAQRDLVQVYLSIEDYENAYKLAKENYENDNQRNPFHIHAYFSALIRLNNIKDKNQTLNKLVGELEVNKHENAKEFFYRCKAQFEAFVNNDPKEALRLINSACKEFPYNYRVLIDKFYICAKFKKTKDMEELIEEYTKKYKSKNTNHNNTIIKLKILLFAVTGESEKIPSIIKGLQNYPEEYITKWIDRYYSSANEVAATND